MLTALFLLNLILGILGPAAPALEFSQSAFAQGEWWRILSCHLVHFSGDHLFWNLLVLGVLASLADRRDHRTIAGALAVSALGIGAALVTRGLDLEFYRGLSGILTSTYVIVGARMIHEGRRRGDRRRVAGTGLLLALLALKLTIEVVAGTTVFVDSQASGFVAVPMAHLIGLLVGLMAIRRLPTTASATAGFAIAK